MIKEVASFAKSESEKLVVGIETWKGHKLIQIRVFYRDVKSEWRPSKKGIALQLNLAGPVAEGIKQAVAEFMKPETAQENGGQPDANEAQ